MDRVIDPTVVQAVSWDVDGTLYDWESMLTELRALARERLCRLQVLSTARAALTLRRLIRQTRGLRKLGGEVAERPAEWDQPAFVDFERTWLLEAIRRAGPQPHMDRTLTAITAGGRRQVVFSDFRSRHKLAVLGVEQHFVEVYAGEDLGGIKPSPVAFDTILRQLDLPPEALLHVGDHDSRDGEAARRAGCQTAILGIDVATVADVAALLA